MNKHVSYPWQAIRLCNTSGCMSVLITNRIIVHSSTIQVPPPYRFDNNRLVLLSFYADMSGGKYLHTLLAR